MGKNCRKPKVLGHPWVPGALATEYNVEYPPKQVPSAKQKSYIQQRNAARGDSVPFDADSSQRIDYRGPAGEPATLLPPTHTPWHRRKLAPETTYGKLHTGAQQAPGCAAKSARRAGALETGAAFEGDATYKEDFCNRGAGKAAESAVPISRPLKPRPFEGVSEHAAHFDNKHSGVPAIVRPVRPLAATVPFNVCTTYGKEYIAKPLPARLGACVDRPWMNCETCPETEASTPANACAERPWTTCDTCDGSQATQQNSGMPIQENSWTKPPFATGRAVFDDRSEHRCAFRDFSVPL